MPSHNQHGTHQAEATTKALATAGRRAHPPTHPHGHPTLPPPPLRPRAAVHPGAAANDKPVTFTAWTWNTQRKRATDFNMILTELDRSLHWDAVGFQEITTTAADTTPRTWQTYHGHRLHLGAKPQGGFAVAIAVHRRWTRYIYHIHFATRSCTVTLRVPTGRVADDTASLQLTTLHAPSLLNHTTDELDVAWHEVVENLRCKRSIRILMTDANCHLGRLQHEQKHAPHEDETATHDARRRDAAIPTPEDAAPPATQRDTGDKTTAPKDNVRDERTDQDDVGPPHRHEAQTMQRTSGVVDHLPTPLLDGRPGLQPRNVPWAGDSGTTPGQRRRHATDATTADVPDNTPPAEHRQRTDPRAGHATQRRRIRQRHAPTQRTHTADDHREDDGSHREGAHSPDGSLNATGVPTPEDQHRRRRRRSCDDTTHGQTTDNPRTTPHSHYKNTKTGSAAREP